LRSKIQVRKTIFGAKTFGLTNKATIAFKLLSIRSYILLWLSGIT
jgi:hypothetical protein